MEKSELAYFCKAPSENVGISDFHVLVKESVDVIHRRKIFRGYCDSALRDGILWRSRIRVQHITRPEMHF